MTLSQPPKPFKFFRPMKKTAAHAKINLAKKINSVHYILSFYT